MNRRLLAGVVSAGVATAAFAVSAPITWGTTHMAGSKPHVQHMAFTVVSVGRGKAGDEVTPVGNFAIAPGVPVRVTVTNYTHQVHTFTVPGMHVNVAILPARGRTPKKTTFTFTAREGGAFAWHCMVCAAQHHRHVMGGTIYAIVDPSVLQ